MATKMWKYIRNKTQHQEPDARQKGTKNLLVFKKTLQHGFPNRPSAIAYDPKLSLIAIGTHNGSIKIYGAPGVECYAQHDNELPVTHIVFLPHQGRLITVCDDNSLHLWELNSRDTRTSLECINSIQLDAPRPRAISALCLSSFHDQLHVGTDSGDIHLLSMGPFEFVDSAVISVEAATRNVTGAASRASPGAVEAIAEHPTDTDQILIGFNRGTLVLWDLKERTPVQTFVANQQLESFCWSNDGSRLLTSHNDGSFWEWIPAQSTEQAEKTTIPYGPFPCKPIPKLLWRKSGGSQPFIIFSGGMPRSRYGDHHTVTVMQGDEKHVVFDFTSRVVDFFVIAEDGSETGAPKALVVLLEEELIAIDLTVDKWPVFQLPYLFVIHSSSITCSHHIVGVSEEVWNGIISAGNNQRPPKLSTNPWPINGGTFTSGQNSSKEILLTGHEDGSVHFWDVSGAYLTLMHKLTTANLFKIDDMDDQDEPPSPDGEESTEWPPFRKVGSFDQYSDDPRLAIQKLDYCTKSNTLLVGGTAGQAVLFEFRKKSVEVGKTLENVFANIVGDRDGFVWKGHSPLILKPLLLKPDAGFQAQMVVQLMPPAAFTSLTIQSDWHLFGAGTAHGFVLIDYLRRKTVCTKCTLIAMDVANGTDATMTRRKSFKKSLRESFRRIRRGRSVADPKRAGVGGGDNRLPQLNDDLALETRPVERQIEARATDNEMSSVVRCLQFASCYIINNVVCSPTFWAGTNNGTVYIYSLVIPLADNRKEEDVHAILSKEIQLQHRAPVIYIAVIDGNGCPAGEYSRPAESGGGDVNAQKVVICSEEQFKLFHLPSLKPFNKYKLTAHEGTLLRKVRIVGFSSKFDGDVHEYCLTCLTNQGDLSVFSLPNLTRHLKQDCIRRDDIQGISTLTFTKTGQGFYQKSPSEFQRFTLSTHDRMEALCSIDIPDSARPGASSRVPNSPASRTSLQSQGTTPVKRQSPESGISLNNHSYSQTVSLSGMRSPDASNLNESLRSEASGGASVDNVRIFSSENGRVSASKSPVNDSKSLQ